MLRLYASRDSTIGLSTVELFNGALEALDISHVLVTLSKTITFNVR